MRSPSGWEWSSGIANSCSTTTRPCVVTVVGIGGFFRFSATRPASGDIGWSDGPLESACRRSDTPPMPRILLSLLGAAAILAGTAAAASADPTVTALALSSTAGQPLSGAVATVAGSCTQVAGASIDWGDGVTSPAGGLVPDAKDGRICDVDGSHTYARPGMYTTTVTVRGPAGAPASANGTATVVAP